MFNPRPKEDRKDVFGRDVELKKFSKYISNKNPGIIITGLRRVGKTTLLGTVLSEMVKHQVCIDLRDLGTKNIVTKKDILAKFQNSISDFLNENKSKKKKLIENLKNITGVQVLGNGIQFGWQRGREVDLSQLFRELNRWAKDNTTYVVLAIDEAQLFSHSKHFNVAAILASIYDNCKNIIIVMTGSEAGLLHEFIENEHKGADLVGRTFDEIKLEPFSKLQSKEFLRRGFVELKKGFEKNSDFEETIDDAVSKLGGIIGWLTMFGAKCNSEDEISKKLTIQIQKKGSKLAKKDFEDFLKNRKGTKRYTSIMKLLANETSSWTNIKKSIALSSPISDSNFSLLIDTLKIRSFIDQDLKSKKYFIPDPLLKFAFCK